MSISDCVGISYLALWTDKPTKEIGAAATVTGRVVLGSGVGAASESKGSKE